MEIGQFSNAIGTILQVLVALCAGFLFAFWLAMIIWTWRDIRARSRDIFAAILASVLVAIFPVIGLLLYLLLRPKETLAEAYDRALEEEALLRSIEEQLVCPNCQRAVDEHWRYCAYCHTQIKKGCPTCGELLELGWDLCPYCGGPASVRKVHTREELEQGLPAAQRAMVTAPPARIAEPVPPADDTSNYAAYMPPTRPQPEASSEETEDAFEDEPEDLAEEPEADDLML